MAARVVEVLQAVGPDRGLVLVAAGAAAWRAVYLLRLDDGRNPLPWAFVLIACLTLITLLSL